MNLPPKPPPSTSGPVFSNPPSAYPSSSGAVNPNFHPPPTSSSSRIPHGLPRNPLLAQQQQQQFPQPPSTYGGNFSYGGLPPANVGARAAAAALGVLGGAQPRYYQYPPPSQQQFSYEHQPSQASFYEPQYQSQPSYAPPPSSQPQVNAQGYTISSAFYDPPPPPPTPSYAYPPQPQSSTSNHYSSFASSSFSQPPPAAAPRPPPPNRRLDTSKISCLPMRNCSLSGCSYTGLYKDVEIHEMDRHLIFPAGWKEKKGKRDGFGGATIEGTSISLQTPEQIAAWVAERKKKWPTKERVEEKAKAREEAIARGEFDPSASRRGGSRGGGRGGARGSARGGRGGFRGGAEFSHSSRGEPAAKKGRWGAQDGEADAGYKSKGGKVAPIAGGNPIEDFDSDPLSSSDDSDGSSDSDSDSGSDIDPVKDAVSSRLPSAPSARPPPAADDEMEDEDAPEVEENVRTLEGTRLCTYFLTPQGCKMGDRCRFVHDGSKRPVAPILPPTRLPPAPRPPPPPTAAFSLSSRPDLLLGLLETDIKHTTSDLSQVIRFLCTNAFLQGVEGRVGELEDEERSGVKEVGEAETGVAVGGEAGVRMEVDA